MASIRLELEVTDKGAESALKRTASGLDGVGRSAGGADKQLKEFTATQQRAAQRMERMHEEAMKLNQGFTATDDKAEAFSNTLRGMSSTATASAAALGLPIGQLGALNSVADVAALGMGNLTKSVAGFNMATLGVVGAGLAIGAMIGTWLREIPAVTKAMDALADSIFGVASAEEEAAKAANFARTGQKEAAAAAAIVGANTVDLLLSQGKTLEEIKKQYKEMPPHIEKYIDSLERFNVEQKRLGDLAKENKVALKGLEMPKGDFYFSDLILDAQIAIEAQRNVIGSAFQGGLMNMGGQGNFTKLMGFAPGGGAIIEIQTQFERVGDEAGLSFSEGMKGALGALPSVILGAFQGGGKLGQSIGALFGGSIFGKDSALMKGLTGAGGLLSKGLGKAFGSVLPGLGTALGGMLGDLGGKLFGKLFGGGEHAKVNDMRDAFLDMFGGFEKLAQQLAKTGDQGLVQKIFDTKTVKDFEAAVKEAQHALEMQGLAQDKLNEAMQRYGIEASDMGAAFQQQNLDEQALQLWQDWQLLNTAMDDTVVLAEKMAPSMQEYINQATAAGATIPENLRPIIESMIEMGLLTDENGEAFKTLEDAGLDFGQSLEESMADAAAAIKDLVGWLKKLYGFPPVNIPVNVGGTGGNAGNGHGGEDTEEFKGSKAFGGPIHETGLYRLHAGEMVLAAGGKRDGGDREGGGGGGGGGGLPPVIDPGDLGGGGGGWLGGGGITGGGGGGGGGKTIEAIVRQAVASRPSLSVQHTFAPVVTGAGNTTEVGRMMNRIARENIEGFRTTLEQIARSAGRRRA